MTPHEEAMKRLAERIALANQLDAAMHDALQPTTSDEEDEK